MTNTLGRGAIRAVLSFAMAAGSVAATACGGSTDGSYSTILPPPENTAPVASATVHATPAIQFTPVTINLTVGGTVTYDFGSVAHDVFFDNTPPGAPDSITEPTANTTVTRTFTKAGRYIYNCHVHPGMSGVINVE
jgi:plastocyanin